MKFSRLLITACTLGLVIPTAYTFAEDKPAAPQGEEKGEHKEHHGRFPSPEEHVAHIDQAVGGLTADEKAKILDIITKSREQMQSVPREERREKMREAMKAQHDAIRAVLTPEQQKKFDEMPRPGPGPRPSA